MCELSSKSKNISCLAILLGTYFIIHFFSVVTYYDYLFLEVIYYIVFLFALKKIRINAYFFVPLFLFIFIRYLLGHSDVEGFGSPANHLVKYFRLLFIPFIIEMFNKTTNKEKRNLLYVIMTCVLLTDLLSIYYTFTDPLAIRYRNIYGEIRYFGIITFSQIFSYGMLNVFLLTKLLKDKVKNLRSFFIVIVFMVNTVMIIKAQLMTPLFIMILTFLLYHFYVINNYKFCFLSVLFFLTFYFLFDNILLSFLHFIQSMDSSILTKRLEATINFLFIGEGQVDSVSNRLAKIMISWDSFQEQPLFGIGFTNYSDFTVGCHQEWFDILAVSGVIGLFCVVLFLILQCRYVLKSCDTVSGRKMFIATFISFIVLGLLDPCLNTDIFVTVFVLSAHFNLL